MFRRSDTLKAKTPLNVAFVVSKPKTFKTSTNVEIRSSQFWLFFQRNNQRSVTLKLRSRCPLQRAASSNEKSMQMLVLNFWVATTIFGLFVQNCGL